MNGDPYQAPGEDGETTDRKQVSLGRRIAVICIFPCLLIVAFCLVPVACAILEIATVRNMALISTESALAAVYLFHAATWTATAWAIWKNRSRAVIAALLADVLALVLMSLP